MNDPIDLSDRVMAEAAQSFFVSEWADAKEAAGFRFAPGTEITEVCPNQEAEKLLELVRPHVESLEQAWGIGVAKMFRVMEIPEDKWADALFYVLMGCRGHGVGLEDDFSENIETAEIKLGRAIEPSPFWSEFPDFADLAQEVVEADSEPDSEAPFQPGDRVLIDGARLPTGDRLHGTATVVCFCREQQCVVVALDRSADIDPWSYQGRTVLIETAECAPLETLDGVPDALQGGSGTSEREPTR